MSAETPDLRARAEKALAGHTTRWNPGKARLECACGWEGSYERWSRHVAGHVILDAGLLAETETPDRDHAREAGKVYKKRAEAAEAALAAQQAAVLVLADHPAAVYPVGFVRCADIRAALTDTTALASVKAEARAEGALAVLDAVESVRPSADVSAVAVRAQLVHAARTAAEQVRDE